MTLTTNHFGAICVIINAYSSKCQNIWLDRLLHMEAHCMKMDDAASLPGGGIDNQDSTYKPSLCDSGILFDSIHILFMNALSFGCSNHWGQRPRLRAGKKEGYIIWENYIVPYLKCTLTPNGYVSIDVGETSPAVVLQMAYRFYLLLIFSCLGSVKFYFIVSQPPEFGGVFGMAWSWRHHIYDDKNYGCNEGHAEWNHVITWTSTTTDVPSSIM